MTCEKSKRNILLSSIFKFIQRNAFCTIHSLMTHYHQQLKNEGWENVGKGGEAVSAVKLDPDKGFLVQNLAYERGGVMDPMSQSTNLWSTNQPTNQSIYQSIDQSISQLSTRQSTNNETKQSTIDSSIFDQSNQSIKSIGYIAA